MRIVHVCDHFLPFIDGLTNHVHNLARQQAKEHDVTILTTDMYLSGREFDDLSSMNTEPGFRGLNICRIRARPIDLPYFRILSALPTLARRLSRSGADVVHTHSYMLAHSDITLAVSRLTNTPVVLTVHAYGRIMHARSLRFASALYSSSVGRVVLPAFNAVIGLDSHAADFLARTGARRDRIHVIPNGVDLMRFSSSRDIDHSFSTAYSLDRNVVLFVGLLQERKGVQHIVDAAPQVLAAIPDTTFVVIGEGEMRPELERRVESRRMGKNFRFLGLVSQDDLVNAYQASSVVVLHSSFEGLPTVILEAMAAGKPVIATPVGGIPSVVEDSKTGILVEYGDVSNLANGISRLLANKDLCIEMGIEAKRAVRRYSWENIGREVTDLYEELIGANREA